LVGIDSEKSLISYHQVLLAPILDGNIALNDSCVCNLCGNVTKGGITREKEQLIADSRNVAAYAKCPKEVREELWRCLKDKKKQERETFHRTSQHFIEDYGDSDEGRAKKHKAVMCSHFHHTPIFRLSNSSNWDFF